MTLRAYTKYLTDNNVMLYCNSVSEFSNGYSRVLKNPFLLYQNPYSHDTYFAVFGLSEWPVKPVSKRDQCSAWFLIRSLFEFSTIFDKNQFHLFLLAMMTSTMTSSLVMSSSSVMPSDIMSAIHVSMPADGVFMSSVHMSIPTDKVRIPPDIAWIYVKWCLISVTIGRTLIISRTTIIRASHTSAKKKYPNYCKQGKIFFCIHDVSPD